MDIIKAQCGSVDHLLWWNVLTCAHPWLSMKHAKVCLIVAVMCLKAPNLDGYHSPVGIPVAIAALYLDDTSLPKSPRVASHHPPYFDCQRGTLRMTQCRNIMNERLGLVFLSGSTPRKAHIHRKPNYCTDWGCPWVIVSNPLTNGC